MDGIIIVNKPKEYTSHDVVNIAKKVFGQKVGHTGTLDPNATGVLPLLIGKGTKLSKYLINHDKIYKATLKLGIKTDTADIWGKIIEERKVEEDITEIEIDKVLKSVLGKQEQLPPMYSAIKINGKKLYEYARKNQSVDIEKRKIEIYEIELIQCNKEEREITFIVKCSKGTYIRTFCETIAEKMGTLGTMSKLERLQVGNFKIEDAITIEQLKNNERSAIDKYFITFEELLKDMPEKILENKEISLFLNGVNLQEELEDGVYKIYTKDNLFIGTGIVKENKLKRDIIIEE